VREFQRSHDGRGIIRVLPAAPQPFDGSEIMPRIPDGFLDCVVYLYRSEDEAKEGSGIGGSGFLAGIISDDVPKPFWYL
jgi:hypothetical protein